MAREPKPAAAETAEVSASRDGLDITRHLMGPLLHFQDSVLQGLGERWQAYREIRRDGQVHSTFQQRRLAVVSRQLVVEPGADDAKSKAAADQLRANLAAIAFDRSTKGMAWGFFYGYAVGECLWSERDGKVWLDGVKVRTPWRFRFGQDGLLRLLTRTNMIQGVALPERKFWVLSSGADNDDDPYGLGLAHHLYWPVYFRKQGLGFWLRALEKFGAPTAVGTYPAGTSLEDQKKLLAAALAVRIDGAVVKPEGTMLELLEGKRGTVDQATFHRQLTGEISKIVLGQTMTTDDGASLSQSKVHYDVREELTDADVEELCESFQQGPARWLTEWNFPGAATPVLRRPSPEDEERASKLRKENAETAKTMSEAGFEPDEDNLATRYPGWRRKAAAMPAAANDPAPLRAVAFAEPGSRATADAIDVFVEGLDWEPVMTPIVDAVEQLVQESGSLEAAADRLATLFTSPADKGLAEHLARALLEAGITGAAGVAVNDEERRAQAAAN